MKGGIISCNWTKTGASNDVRNREYTRRFLNENWRVFPESTMCLGTDLVFNYAVLWAVLSVQWNDKVVLENATNEKVIPD